MELDVVGKIIELSWELELASKSPWIFVTRESMDFSYLFWSQEKWVKISQY